jgi:hypothetical protein
MNAIRRFAIICAVAALTIPTTATAATLSYDQLVAQAQSLQQDGERLAAFCDYVEAYRLQPTANAASSALIKSVRDGSLPLHVPDSVLNSLVGLPGPVVVTSQLDGNVTVVTTRDETSPLNDPQNGWPFTRVAWIYRASSEPHGDMVCFAAIRFQTGDDQEMAERTGRLLSVIRQALVDKTGYKPLTDGVPFTVWLCRHATDAGGEQWRNSIYFYDIESPRASIEWIREIAHEFSHMALPIVGGDYTAPEPWANGYYGERLLLRWLSRGGGGGPAAVEKAWGGTFAGYPNFDAKLVAPALTTFAAHGISNTWIDRRDREGMEYLIGLLLTVDDKAGPKACADLLWNLPKAGLVDPRLLLPGARVALAQKLTAQSAASAAP